MKIKKCKPEQCAKKCHIFNILSFLLEIIVIYLAALAIVDDGIALCTIGLIIFGLFNKKLYQAYIKLFQKINS